ncbi:MAG: M48 family metallopeptidase [Azonexus sp.]|jgi:STE24 endopeptidase|nr:M48 family metallopeptidase [Betaproteobacteria bacterium]MBK8918631.1 M48 family metallopeptidase [Betaproteobacteria bacterium]MBP6034564.1 M48 family metallopeptidase [Azonexus sp.]MBP6905104.1 M48 family metallopeptidase [Azonexus sp.]
MIASLSATTFTALFVAALATTLVLRLWLATRQAAHVARHASTVPAQFAGRIGLDAHRKAAAYTVTKTRFGMTAALADGALLAALTLGGGIAALDALWSGVFGGHGHAYGLALIFSVFAIQALIDLPFSLYRQFIIEARFGFNRMTLGLFFSDVLKQALLAAVIGAPLLLAVLWLMGNLGSTWWLTVWVFWCAFSLALHFIYPTWIAPLFNKFSPLAEGEMKARIEALLGRCGFRSSGLFVMDGSRRSSHGNAYFTGFGDSKRIVFFDTLLERLAPAEVEAVLAHELGHFRRRHVVKHIALSFLLSLFFLWLLGMLLESPGFYAGLGAPGDNTALALVLFFLVIPVFTFPFHPLTSSLSRRHEFEADAYAADHASADDLVRALVKLYQDNAATLTPDPLHSLFYDSHPPAAQRIEHLNRLRPV